MKSIRYILCLAITLHLSCSMGTEVGNGARPKPHSPDGGQGGGSKPDQNVDNSTKDANNDESAPSSSTNGNKTGSKSAKPGQNENSTTGSTDSTNAPGSQTTSSPSGSPSTMNIRTYIMAACASPWADMLASPVSLVSRNPSQIVTDQLTATIGSDLQSWTLHFGNKDLNIAESIYFAKRPISNTAGSFATTITDSTSVIVKESFACSNVTSEVGPFLGANKGSVTKRTVTLKNNEQTLTVLSWYLSNDPSPTLLRISVEQSGMQSVTFDAL